MLGASGGGKDGGEAILPEADDIAGERAEIAERGVKAVHPSPLRRRRGLGLGHRRGALRLARGRIGLVEQHRGEALAHVPLPIMGQHAEQDVGAPPRRGPMEHRTQFEIDGLQRAEGVLSAAETFVGAHRGVGRQPTGLSRGGIGLCGRQVVRTT